MRCMVALELCGDYFGSTKSMHACVRVCLYVCARESERGRETDTPSMMAPNLLRSRFYDWCQAHRMSCDVRLWQ